MTVERDARQMTLDEWRVMQLVTFCRRQDKQPGTKTYLSSAAVLFCSRRLMSFVWCKITRGTTSYSQVWRHIKSILHLYANINSIFVEVYIEIGYMSPTIIAQSNDFQIETLVTYIVKCSKYLTKKLIARYITWNNNPTLKSSNYGWSSASIMSYLNY